MSILMEAACPEVLLSVARAGLEDPTQTVQETAILALGPLMNSSLEPEALAVLAPLVASEDWRDRWRSATTLSLSQSSEAQKLLAILRQDSNHYVVAAVLEARARHQLNQECLLHRHYRVRSAKPAGG